MNNLFKRAVIFAVLPTYLTGCAGILPTNKLARDEDPQVLGSAVRMNRTPLDPVYACMSEKLTISGIEPLAIAVGEVKDYTGKYNINEGNSITQGGALMVYSALGKLGDAIAVQERFDTRIAEQELSYADKRQLTDGKSYVVEDGKAAVPWMPYYGGTINKSKYYIVGGITEANYDIASNGAEGSVNLIGPKARVFTMSIGVDLRIVDSTSLRVVKTISLTKQMKGEEVGLGVYNFFGNNLYNLNVGSKRQEPIHLGVRTALEEAVLQLVSTVTKVDYGSCSTLVDYKFTTPAQKQLQASKTIADPKAVDVVSMRTKGKDSIPGVLPQNAHNVMNNIAVLQIPFEFTAASVTSAGNDVLTLVKSNAKKNTGFNIQLIARDSEQLSPAKRYELAMDRVKTVTDQLVASGVKNARIKTIWLPDPTDSTITRDGAGYQIIGVMSIEKL